MANPGRPLPGDVGLMFREPTPAPQNTRDSRRRLVAEFCRFLAGPIVCDLNGRGTGDQDAAGRANQRRPPSRKPGADVAAGHRPIPPADGQLSRRLAQTLELLLSGDGEKQIAAKLGLSRHTVHVYVKSLYKHFEVCSRAELLARWVVRPRR